MIDITTVAGLALGIFAVFGGALMEGLHLSSILQFTAFVIVLGGTVGAMLLTTPMDTLLLGLKMTKSLFLFNPKEPEQIGEQIVKFAETARRESIFALEKVIPEVTNPFLAKALRFAADGSDHTTIEELMEVDIHLAEHRETEAGKMYEVAGGYAPTIGIIGAVLGLIHVMGGLARGASTAELGGGIGVAFVATIYGVGAANLVFIPFGGKIKARAQFNKRVRQMILAGVLGIVFGYNPRIIAERMKAYYE